MPTNLQQLTAQLFQRFARAQSKHDLILELQSGRYGDAISYLAEYVKHPDEQLQTFALDAMMQIDSQRATQYAIPLLASPDWQYSICYWIARYGGSEDIIMPLTNVLLTSTDADARYMAGVALMEIGDKRALPALKHAQQYDEGEDHDGHSISGIAVEAIDAILART